MTMETVTAEKRDTKGRFTKGNAPLSPGRPPLPPDFKAACQKVGSELFLDLLKDVKAKKIKEPDLALRIIQEALNRGYGKAPQAITSDPTQPFEIQVRFLAQSAIAGVLEADEPAALDAPIGEIVESTDEP